MSSQLPDPAYTPGISGDPSSSLEPLETTGEPAPPGEDAIDAYTVPDTSAQHRIHAANAQLRRRLIDIAASSGIPSLVKRSLRMADCCRYPILALTDSGKLATGLGRCRDRLCPTCSSARGSEVARRFAGLVRQMNAPRFLTLTQQTRPGEDLDIAYFRLAENFRTLRKTRPWTDHVLGGVYSIEVTRGARGEGWHVHCHIIYDGAYWPHSEVKSLWHDITGDSHIVDIRCVVDRRRTAEYIAAYVSKPTGLQHWSRDQVIEWAQAMKGKRLVHTFGTLHGAKCDEQLRHREPLSQPLCSIAKLMQRSDAGCTDARSARRILARLAGPFWTLLHDHTCARIDELEPPTDDELEWAIDVCRRIGEHNHAADVETTIDNPPRERQTHFW